MRTKIWAITTIVAITGALVLVTASANLAPVYAAINSVTTDTGCTNGGGNSPGGQQPTCTGGGLTQQQETENQNPAGSAPPGQNK